MVGSMGNANRLHILFYLNKPQCDIYGSMLRNRFLVKLCKLKAHLSILGKKISQNYFYAWLSFTVKQRSRLSMSTCYFHFSLFCLLGWLPRIVHTEGFCPLDFVLQKFLECLQMSYCKATALRTTAAEADARGFLKLWSASSQTRPANALSESSSFTAVITNF